MIIKTRNDLGKLFQNVNKKGVGAEIGVQFGYNAKENILNGYEGKLLCVDIWDDRTQYESAKNLLHGSNVELIINDSVSASKNVPDGSLDFVYIDADHTYQGVKADYEAWLPKVRKGGIVGFHDYGLNGDCEGVKQFIDELMPTMLNVVFNFTTDDFWQNRPYQTCYFTKP